LFTLALSLAAIVADQFAAPILHTTSPLWTTLACLLLVWRRGKTALARGEAPFDFSLSFRRLIVFFAAHLVLILMARAWSSVLQPVAGTVTAGGTLVAAGKMSVLAPTILLLPLGAWKEIAKVYFPESIAGLVVLLTYFPRRVLEGLWPWHGQILGRFVFALAGIFVSGLGYDRNLTPTLTGPELDVTIVLGCSGINGLELFDYLFGVITVLDWNRFRKGRVLIAYFMGLFAMLLGNALRIASFVVVGNHGYAEQISRFHISAGWIFFSLVFVFYLALMYRWMLHKRANPPQDQQAN